ncbi:hypothetical protein OS493_011992 [Desmophyllum pertusum]|uniref:Uncharacterized protein n=1 Tax=Desmophyllum pertusum TaxID=174260 RepID=A0A9X0A659_9CNID|nr:hypothetical protein OS493_011992 [Desmophyllum pertusum]
MYFTECEEHILDTLKMMFHPKAGSQIYCNEVCNLLGKACDIECSTKMATDLLEKAYQDADPPVKRKRMKVAGSIAGQNTRANVYVFDNLSICENECSKMVDVLGQQLLQVGLHSDALRCTQMHSIGKNTLYGPLSNQTDTMPLP